MYCIITGIIANRVYRPHPANSYDTKELKEFVGFCVKYQCEQTLQFVTNVIRTRLYQFHAAQLVNITIKHQICEFFSTGFERLLKIPIQDISKVHQELMGNEVFVALVYAKATLNEHCCIVATEEPPILLHVDNCKDPQACRQDWHAIWWNGMGHFLLDGRNPQPFDRAVDRFRCYRNPPRRRGHQTGVVLFTRRLVRARKH